MKNKLNKNTLEKIKNILLKKSEGYFYNEEILEYQNNITETKINNEQLNFLENNNEKENSTKHSDLTLIKKKITTHYVPPDLLAIKMLIENFGEKVEENNLSFLSDDELEKLKNEIINKLQNY